jgi:hypothetical protein
MDARPWKRERIIEFPRSPRNTEPLPVHVDGVYCGTCGARCTIHDTFCGMCGLPLHEHVSQTYATLPLGLTGSSWHAR